MKSTPGSLPANQAFPEAVARLVSVSPEIKMGGNIHGIACGRISKHRRQNMIQAERLRMRIVAGLLRSTRCWSPDKLRVVLLESFWDEDLPEQA